MRDTSLSPERATRKEKLFTVALCPVQRPQACRKGILLRQENARFAADVARLIEGDNP